MIPYLFGGLISFVFVLLSKGMVVRFLQENHMTIKNYKGDEIPQGIGILLLMATMISSVFLLLTTNQSKLCFLYLFGLSVVGLGGMLDDLLGTQDVKGLRGHIHQLTKGRMTTGAIKIITTGVVSLFISISYWPEWMDVFINLLLMMLYTNTINLFDVRPGRAVKIFLLGNISLWIMGDYPWCFISFLLTGGLLAVFKGDLQCKYILGDVGSNILGFTLGFAFAVSVEGWIKIAIIVLLFILHIIAETSSISYMIEQSKWLSCFDQMGRNKK
jgi:UDP-N-acetylmuramyl pentapeptide phosphotransferase/UDP-N-acetylglucosamine-1-phosphate transferase